MRPNLIAGAGVVVLGLAATGASLQSALGTPAEMGPGLFPLILSCLLMVLGILVAVGHEDSEAATAIPWRGALLIAAAPLVFFATINALGIVVSIFAASLMSALASNQARLIPAILFSIGLGVLCALVFVVGLGLELPIFGTLFTGG